MGSLFSSDESNEQTENSGNSNINNVIIAKPVELDHADLAICIYIITAILIFNLIITMYKINQKYMKKKYVVPTIVREL